MAPTQACRIFLAALGFLALSSIGRAETNRTGDLLPDGLTTTLAGSYLAGMSADSAHDIEAARIFFDAALENDPENGVLLERVLLLHIADGDVEGAEPFADRLIVLDVRNQIARLTRAILAVKQKKYERAQVELAQSTNGPLAVLTGGLVTAWSQQGLGRVEDGLATINALNGPNWFGIFKDYHEALILDLAGRTDEAVAAITAAYQADNANLRVVEGYGRILARAGKRNEAIVGLNEFLVNQPKNPVIGKLLAGLQAGLTPEPQVSDAATGSAEILYGLGAAIGIEEGTELPAAYLHLAHYLDPQSYLNLMTLGDIFVTAEQCEEAIAVYAQIPEKVEPSAERRHPDRALPRHARPDRRRRHAHQARDRRRSVRPRRGGRPREHLSRPRPLRRGGGRLHAGHRYDQSSDPGAIGGSSISAAFPSSEASAGRKPRRIS